MSTTPRTDDVTDHPRNIDLHNLRRERRGEPEILEVVNADFARTLETELAQAKAEVEALRKDKERLDWMDSARASITRPQNGLDNRAICGTGEIYPWPIASNTRQAIDTAASKAREGK